MPLVPLPSATPSRKEQGTQFPENPNPSWSRHWIAQHPPKPSKAELTVQPPSLVAADEKYPSLSTVDHISPLHQILPLYALPSIVELPKQELSLEPKAEPNSPTPHQSQEVIKSTIQESDQAIAGGTLEETDKAKEKSQDVRGVLGMANMPSLSPIAEASNVPLPTSPADEEYPISPSSQDGLKSAQQLDPRSDAPKVEAGEPAGESKAEEQNTWASRLNSILPNAIMDRQDTDAANTRASRSSSLAPGAYPESDATEESLRQNHGVMTEDEQDEKFEPKASSPMSDDKSIRPRKSVSIVLPDGRNETKEAAQKRLGDNKASLVDRGDISSPLTSDNVNGSKTEAKQGSEGNGTSRDDDPGETETVSVDQKVSAPKASEDVFPRLLQTPTQREASPISRNSSIAASHDDTDKTDMSTLHERESIAPSDTDRSSLKPLLSSSPRDARSSLFSESLDEGHTDHMAMESAKQSRNTEEKGANSSPDVDDSSSLSTIGSSNNSETGKTHRKRDPEYPSSPVDSGEGSSKAASSLPPPKIVVKDASSADESLRSPWLVAPTTTPVDEASTLPRRQTTFIALGEPLEHDREVKLPMKRRKLYIRKARYAVLRQPLLNAALGRQIGAQAKQGLKKAATEPVFKEQSSHLVKKPREDNYGRIWLGG